MSLDSANIDAPKPVSIATSVLSCVMYSVCSISMVLTNKAISTSVPDGYHDRLPRFGVVLYQSVVAVLLVSGAKFFRIIDYPEFSTKIAISWIPVNILFVGMICSGFLSLVYVNVPMVTIFKNLANILVVAGECFIFGEKVSYLVMLSIGVMTAGAILAAQNDLEFNVTGYFWMMTNAMFSAGYILYLRHVSTSIRLTKFGMVFYNNLLSCALILPLVLLSGELGALLTKDEGQDQGPRILTPSFVALNSLAGFLGFYLNFAALWCVASTSATTYSIVGSMNKIPVLVLGFLMFRAKMTFDGVMFIMVALLGGFIFMYAKLPKSK